MNSNEIILLINELDLNSIQPNSETYKNADQGGSKIVVIGKPGCFQKGTKILMYNGSIKNVEDIQTGDIVMGDDSGKKIVQELCSNIDKMYEICPLYCDKVIVNNQHILSLINEKNTIIDITVEKYLNCYTQYKKYKWFKTSVEFPEQELLVDPYLFGNSLHLLYDIPDNYKINTMYHRLELIAGFLDEHSYYTSTQIEIVLNSFLYEDFSFLIQSVGLLIKKEEDVATNVVKCVILGEISKIPTQKYKYKNTNHTLHCHFSIRFDRYNRYYGFVLNDNHRFLLKDFSVVHNTGKSTLISSLLYAKRDIYPCGIIFSGTEDSNGYYKQMFPNSFIYDKYDEKILKQFIKRQKLSKTYLPNPWAICLLDDCTDDPIIFNKPVQQGIFKNSRHWKMLYILSLQYCMDVKPVIRTNVDGTFILRETNLKNRKSLWENYAGIISDFSQFCDIMDQLTDDYTALYIHNATKSNKLEDCLFWYKAIKVPSSFKFGSKYFWDFHITRYNNNYVDNYNTD